MAGDLVLIVFEVELIVVGQLKHKEGDMVGWGAGGGGQACMDTSGGGCYVGLWSMRASLCCNKRGILDRLSVFNLKPFAVCNRTTSVC